MQARLRSRPITDAARINYTWFEHLLIDGPWNRGRVVLIGDAAHTCPHTIALGVAMALEDASVLAEMLLTRDRVARNCSTPSWPAACRVCALWWRARCNW